VTTRPAALPHLEGVTATPEPSGFVLVGTAGSAGLLALARRRVRGRSGVA
jgi:hypothetical protein